MTISNVQIPDEIYKKLAHKKNISYEDIIECYEDTFEYEKVWMEAWDFKNFLISELSHD